MQYSTPYLSRSIEAISIVFVRRRNTRSIELDNFAFRAKQYRGEGGLLQIIVRYFNSDPVGTKLILVVVTVIYTQLHSEQKYY